MKWEDFNDNEYIENLVNELKENGQNVVVGKFDELINWGRSNSLWPLTFATSCCGIEFISLGAARYDMARFGFEVARSSPRQADFMMVAGTIVHRMAPVFRRLYEQLAEPKYVIAVGGCLHPGMSSSSGSDVLRLDAASAQSQGGKILWRSEPQAHARRLLPREPRDSERGTRTRIRY